MAGGLLGLAQDYKQQAAGAVQQAGQLGDQRDANNKAMKQAEDQGRIGMVTAGAGTGAAIGSVVPGVGTAIGAGVGAGVGLLASFF